MSWAAGTRLFAAPRGKKEGVGIARSGDSRGGPDQAERGLPERGGLLRSRTRRGHRRARRLQGRGLRQGLNFPTGLAFLGDKDDFKVLVVESGTGLPSDCNDNTLPPFGGKYSPNNPFTPDLIVLDKNGRRIAGPYFKPTSPHDGYQADGPAIGLVFERGTEAASSSPPTPIKASAARAAAAATTPRGSSRSTSGPTPSHPTSRACPPATIRPS